MPDFLPTHYAYIPGPNGVRVPVDWFDLDQANIRDRREFIGHLLRHRGTPIAKMPEGWFNDLDELEEHLNDPPIP